MLRLRYWNNLATLAEIDFCAEYMGYEFVIEDGKITEARIREGWKDEEK